MTFATQGCAAKRLVRFFRFPLSAVQRRQGRHFREAMRLGMALALLAWLPLPAAAESEDSSEASHELVEVHYEVTVTARRQEERLLDVPVTIAPLTEEALDRYSIVTLPEAAKLVPNFFVFHEGSGNGSSIYLRGIGSSPISAAFDQSVAINVDGVVVNIGRFIHNAYMDMDQIEVLKGPQSLYFGKSASAGVISVTTNDPSFELEMEATAGYETEHNQRYLDFVLSGPVTDTLSARLAVGDRKASRLFENLAPGVRHRYRGEQALNARLTLLWEPNLDFRARLKYSYSEYDNNGANGRTEEICPDGQVQPTAIPSASFPLALFPGVDDCKLNGNTSMADLHPALRAGLPYGGDDGIPFLNQDTHFLALQADWRFAENLSLTAVTGYVDLEHIESDIYDYNAGVFGGLHRNVYESFSQELRLASSFARPFNFQAGLYYQDVSQVFNAYQYAFNLGIIAGPDPVTGWQYDYNKNHYLDTKVFSFFLAGYLSLTDALELSAGLRYTKEEKDGRIRIPYLHAAAGAFGFGAPPLIDGLQFNDDDLSPEVALTYRPRPNLNLFAAYKEGFKSGGVDNSALPTATLNPSNPEFPNFLIYESEEAKGFEVGMKSELLDGGLRLNGTLFQYRYDDLQVQLFDGQIIQFRTFNASELKTEGLEFDLSWTPGPQGLSVRAGLAITDTKYTEDFVNATGQNLVGEAAILSPDLAGFVGATYDWPIAGRWRLSLSADARFNDGYPTSATLNPYTQDSFWLLDAALRLYSSDERYELALIGRNLGDEIYAATTAVRPGACANPGPPPGPPLPTAATCNPDPANVANSQDQVVTTSLGRQFALQFRVRL